MYPYNLEENDIFSNALNVNIQNCINENSNKEDNNLENMPSLDEYILELIKQAIIDECSDAKFYKNLCKKTNDLEEQEILRKIYLDELKHRKIFEEIYCQLTGEKPMLSCDERPISDSLTENYAQAMLNELEAVEFYRKILFSFLSIPIRDWIYEIITDEQAHAQKLNYLYSKNN